MNADGTPVFIRGCRTLPARQDGASREAAVSAAVPTIRAATPCNCQRGTTGRSGALAPAEAPRSSFDKSRSNAMQLPGRHHGRGGARSRRRRLQGAVSTNRAATPCNCQGGTAGRSAALAPAEARRSVSRNRAATPYNCQGVIRSGGSSPCRRRPPSAFSANRAATLCNCQATLGAGRVRGRASEAFPRGRDSDSRARTRWNRERAGSAGSAGCWGDRGMRCSCKDPVNPAVDRQRRQGRGADWMARPAARCGMRVFRQRPYGSGVSRDGRGAGRFHSYVGQAADPVAPAVARAGLSGNRHGLPSAKP
jgi:hypothetical protein